MEDMKGRRTDGQEQAINTKRFVQLETIAQTHAALKLQIPAGRYRERKCTNRS